ncbi:MAG: hypothetical protein H0W82_05450 [Actinobacteria bacterium]|nr:hypothetical protein [Actinomycetota bacterium]
MTSRALAIAAVALAVISLGFPGIVSDADGEALPTPAPVPPVPEVVPHAKFVKAVTVMRRQRARAERLSALLSHRESYQDTLTLAHLTFPAAPVSLADRIMRCESGGGGEPRAWAANPRSSAGGRAQYLDSTWAGTVFGRAGLSRFDPVAGVFAIFRHFQSGGSSSPWTASRGCWG